MFSDAEEKRIKEVLSLREAKKFKRWSKRNKWLKNNIDYESDIDKKASECASLLIKLAAAKGKRK